MNSRKARASFTASSGTAALSRGSVTARPISSLQQDARLLFAQRAATGLDATDPV